MTYARFMEGRLAALEQSGDPVLLPWLRATRALIDQHQGSCEGGHECLTCHLPVPCPSLRIAAMPLEDHPEFDPAWRVPRP